MSISCILNELVICLSHVYELIIVAYWSIFCNNIVLFWVLAVQVPNLLLLYWVLRVPVPLFWVLAKPMNNMSPKFILHWEEILSSVKYLQWNQHHTVIFAPSNYINKNDIERCGSSQDSLQWLFHGRGSVPYFIY